MEDRVFGKMTFNFGWTKHEKLNLWEKTYNIRIRTSNLKDELPTEKQQKSYMQYKTDIMNVCSVANGKLNAYIDSCKEQILEQIGVQFTGNVSSLLTPYEVLFFQNGKYAILFSAKWTESDVCILCDGTNIMVDGCYVLESEY